MRPIALSGHSRPLTRVRYNLHGDLLFSSSKDNTIIAWRSHNGERLGAYSGNKGTVTDIDPNYDTSVLLASTAGSVVLMWDVETGKCIRSYNLEGAPVRFARFGQGHEEAFYIIDASVGNAFSTLVIFDVKEFKRDENDHILRKMIFENESKVTAAVWGDLNKSVITGHDDGTICISDPNTQRITKSERIFEAQVTDIQMDNHYGYMICSSKDQTAKIIDTKTLETMKMFKIDRPLNSASISPIRPHVILGGGQEAVAVTTTRNEGKFKVRFFHMVYEEELGSLEGHFGPVNTLQFNPDGRSFSSGGEDGYVRINHFDDDYFEFKCGDDY